MPSSFLSDPILNYSFGLPVYPLHPGTKKKLQNRFLSRKLKNTVLKPYSIYADQTINFDNVHFVIHENFLKPKYRQYLFEYYGSFYATGAPTAPPPPPFKKLGDVMSKGQDLEDILSALKFIPDEAWTFFFHVYRVPVGTGGI